MSKGVVHVAACGICCSVCGLNRKGICLPCGSGLKKDEKVVKRKMEEQMKHLGHVCPLLQCVVDKKIGFCMRDCPEFPCKSYTENVYPYSGGFFEMYTSRNR